MDGVLEYGLISDDPAFASVMSSYFQEDGYFPIFSLPRMARHDWEFEVHKRAVAIKRSGVGLIFCQAKDYGLLAPLRSITGMDFIGLENPDDVLSVVDINSPKESLEISKKDHLIGLLTARIQGKALTIIDENSHIDSPFPEQEKSNTGCVIETTNRITDVCAVNYAWAKGYEIRFVDPVSKELASQVKDLFISLAAHDALKNVSFESVYAQISIAISRVLDWPQLQEDFTKVQFIISSIPLGILIDSIPVAHLRHLQSELRFIDEFFDLQAAKHVPKGFGPSLLFVDVGEEDLMSEIPEISENLKGSKCWQFNLSGRNANCENFDLYASHFPYDLMLISGHGKSPDCREVTYSFEDLRGKRHEMKLLEYYQLRPAKDEMVLVTTKQYFLACDGIPWEDKEKLAQIAVPHVARQWMQAEYNHETTVVTSKDVSPQSMQGIALYDGVFAGFIHMFSQANHPVLVLNTCASLIELADMFLAAGPRALIGTMWSVYDQDACKFANSFFDEIVDVSLCEAFHKARLAIKKQYSRIAYLYYGTLDGYLLIRPRSADEKLDAKIMGSRMANSVFEVLHFVRKGWISEDQVGRLTKLTDITERFVESAVPQKLELRQKINMLRTGIDLGTMGSGDPGLSSPIRQ